MQRAVPLRPSTWVAVGLDPVLVVAAYAGAQVLRFEGRVPYSYEARFAASIVLIAATYVVIGLLNGVYAPRGSMLRVSGTSLFSLCLVVAGEVFMDRPLPLSVVIVGGLVSTVGAGGWRLAASAWLH